MADSVWQIFALMLYFVAMIGIGLHAYRQTTDHEDYMIAGRKLSPTTAALSAGASDIDLMMRYAPRTLPVDSANVGRLLSDHQGAA